VEPAPVPSSPPPTAEPAPTPTTESPSGLNFPQTPKAGGASESAYRKKFIYTNFGLGFSSSGGLSQFNVSAAPALGFRLSEKFAIGPGVSYAYSSFSLPDNSQFVLTANGDKSINTSSIGLKAFAQFIVYKEFFIHAEYEVTKAELVYQDNSTLFFYKQNRTVTTPLAGIGYRENFSENAAADLVILYNFNNTLYSLYPNPVIRFSFLFNIGR
jgi:hypothetical protein